jgi:hypothetical protein
MGDARGFDSNYLNLLSFEIVSEPSMAIAKAWLLIAISIYGFRVPAIHLVFQSQLLEKAAILVF